MSSDKNKTQTSQGRKSLKGSDYENVDSDTMRLRKQSSLSRQQKDLTTQNSPNKD